MPDYREMYLTLMKASEEALDILLAAQRQCEKIYLAPGGSDPQVSNIKTEEG